jgi:hypothetical protein
LQIINCDVYNKDGLEFIYFVPTKSAEHYYNKENEWIFYQDVKNGEFWCDYNRYWEIFKSEFNLKYEEIEAITKLLVEEALKREVVTPQCFFPTRTNWVEEALKREVTKPSASNVRLFYQVEDALKRKLL